MRIYIAHTTGAGQENVRAQSPLGEVPVGAVRATLGQAVQAASRPRKGKIPPALILAIPRDSLWARGRTPGDTGGVMSRQLPGTPSLEFLKKQAKELLAAHRSDHPDWTLADAQHALAREYGFDSWPKLKHHVEAAAPVPHPFVGTWRADITRSKRNPTNLFKRATLTFSIAGDTITIAHDAVDESGRDDRDVNTVEADGVERVHEHGYRMTVRWSGPRALDVMTTHAGLEARFAKYEVSADGETMTVSTVDQRLVFARV